MDGGQMTNNTQKLSKLTTDLISKSNLPSSEISGQPTVPLKKTGTGHSLTIAKDGRSISRQKPNYLDDQSFQTPLKETDQASLTVLMDQDVSVKSIEQWSQEKRDKVLSIAETMKEKIKYWEQRNEPYTCKDTQLQHRAKIGRCFDQLRQSLMIKEMPTKDGMTAYYEALEGFPIAFIIEATKRLEKQHKYASFPRIAEWIDCLNAIDLTHSRGPLRAVQTLITRITHVNTIL